MPEYLIFFNDEWVTETTDAGWQQRSRDVLAVLAEMKTAGVYIFAGGLDNDAQVVHVEPGGGTPLFTDGPYTETKEVIGGFAAVDVPDEASARYWAGRIAVACDWPQEVRIFRTPAQIPAPDADRAAAAAREANGA
ncbi:MAG TPA: YciI family protein [Solirubrobacteraceae bacterium]|nr:YciI family protein [Solirubrobacteraceae bacterium]